MTPKWPNNPSAESPGYLWTTDWHTASNSCRCARPTHLVLIKTSRGKRQETGLIDEKTTSQRGCIIPPGPQGSGTWYPCPGSCYHVALSLGPERENRTTLSCPAWVGGISGCQIPWAGGWGMGLPGAHCESQPDSVGSSSSTSSSSSNPPREASPSQRGATAGLKPLHTALCQVRASFSLPS